MNVSQANGNDLECSQALRNILRTATNVSNIAAYCCSHSLPNEKGKGISLISEKNINKKKVKKPTFFYIYNKQ